MLRIYVLLLLVPALLNAQILSGIGPQNPTSLTGAKTITASHSSSAVEGSGNEEELSIINSAAGCEPYNFGSNCLYGIEVTANRPIQIFAQYSYDEVAWVNFSGHWSPAIGNEDASDSVVLSAPCSVIELIFPNGAYVRYKYREPAGVESDWQTGLIIDHTDCGDGWRFQQP